MKAIILASGLGTRLSEETILKPKPMVEVGGRRILWHMMKLYSAHGVNDFVICCGYKCYIIKEYFANYFLHMSDNAFKLGNQTMNMRGHEAPPWEAALGHTGTYPINSAMLRGDKHYTFVEGKVLMLQQPTALPIKNPLGPMCPI